MFQLSVQLEKYAEAEEVFRQGIKISTTDSIKCDMMRNLGYILKSRNENDEAIKVRFEAMSNIKF